MVAEFSSLTIGTELNLPTDIPNHASYIESWIKNLKNDKREIFRAAAAAQKCADYCLGFHPDYAASVTHATDNDHKTTSAASLLDGDSASSSNVTHEIPSSLPRSAA